MCDPITIAAVVGAGATVASAQEQRKAGKAAQRQYEAEGRKAEIQNIRSVRQQIREARLAQAAMTNVAAQTGGMGGSGLAGGISSVGTQLAGNLNYMQQIARENTAIGAAAAEGAQAMSNAAVYGTVGKLSGTIFEGMGGYPQLSKNLRTQQQPVGY
jgi:hypothetical protein